MFGMAMPPKLMSEKYFFEIVDMHLFQEILRDDLVLSGDTAHPAGVIALQVMQINEIWGPCFACMEHDAADERIVNYSAGRGNGKGVGYVGDLLWLLRDYTAAWG